MRGDPSIRERAKTLEAGFPDGFGRGPGERDALVRLACLPSLTPMHLRVLAWEEGTATGCVRAIEAGRMGSDLDRHVLSSVDPADLLRATERAGARFAPVGSPGYWPAFLRLHDPPIAVFLRGQPLGPADDRVAMIGSRRPTALGREVAVDLARNLAAAGVVVVSGGALGIDAEAHRGALLAAGRTIAVLGSGIDMDYPRTNARLLARIERSGTILSEYPPGVPAEQRRFPARNRLIAALARALVVVEATANSGTRSTAEHAEELGIDIYAVPGPVTSPLSQTPHALIRDGATLVGSAAELLADLKVERREGPAPEPQGLPEDERRAFDALAGAMLPDAVAGLAGMSAHEAMVALARLELRGLVRGVGGRYQRTFDRDERSEGRRTATSEPHPTG
jgi:DNA processing protein